MTEMVTLLGSAVAVFLTMFCYSAILWRDNKLFRFTEATFIGVGLSYQLVINLYTIKDKAVVPMLSGNFYYVIGLAAGVMILFRVVSKYAWISRFSMAFLVGIGTGLAMLGSAEANFWKMLEATYVPLIGGKYTPLDNLFMIVATITVLYYFFFTYKPKGALEPVSKAGRYFMVFALGGFFGNVVLARLTWLSSTIGEIVTFFMSLF